LTVFKYWPCNASIWCYLVIVRNILWEIVVGTVIKVKLES